MQSSGVDLHGRLERFSLWSPCSGALPIRKFLLTPVSHGTRRRGVNSICLQGSAESPIAEGELAHSVLKR